jgi:hypothetical protein
MGVTNFDQIKLDALSAGDPSALLFGAGTSAAPATTAEADKNFLEFRVKNTATSGDNRGLYLREYIAGAGGGGEALRVFTTVDDVAGATAHGMHCSLNFDTSGSVTGQGIAGRFTLHMPATALAASNVTYSAIQAEIWSDAATSDPAGNLLSAIRIVNGGNATGAADVDDDCALFDLQGWTAASGNMFVTGLTEATIAGNLSAALRVRIGAVTYYIPLADALT